MSKEHVQHKSPKNNFYGINPPKTIFMVFHSPSTPISKSIFLCLDDNRTQISDSTKFRSVVLERHLKFNFHVQSLVQMTSTGNTRNHQNTLSATHHAFALSLTPFTAINLIANQLGGTHTSHGRLHKALRTTTVISYPIQCHFIVA